MLLDGGIDRMYDLVSAECRSRGWELHFATAWEMRQAVDRL
jgi:hypothetical protein